MKRKKILVVCAFAFAALLVFCTGCGGAEALPGDLQADQLEASAEEMMDALNERDWDTLDELYGDNDLTPEDWSAQLDPVLDEFGDFEGYASFETTTMKDNTTGDELAVVLVRCNYDKISCTYAVSFNADGSTAGLRIVGT